VASLIAAAPPPPACASEPTGPKVDELRATLADLDDARDGALRNDRIVHDWSASDQLALSMERNFKQ